jgi:hypothetical protein
LIVDFLQVEVLAVEIVTGLLNPIVTLLMVGILQGLT